MRQSDLEPSWDAATLAAQVCLDASPHLRSVGVTLQWHISVGLSQKLVLQAAIWSHTNMYPDCCFSEV